MSRILATFSPCTHILRLSWFPSNIYQDPLERIIIFPTSTYVCMILFTGKNSVITQVYIKSEAFVCVCIFISNDPTTDAPEHAKLGTAYFCHLECLALDAQLLDRTGLEHGVMGLQGSQAGHQLALNRGYNCVLGAQTPPGHLNGSWTWLTSREIQTLLVQYDQSCPLR